MNFGNDIRRSDAKKCSMLLSSYFLSNLCLCLLYIYLRLHIKTQTVEDESKSVWNVLLEQQIYCIILLVGTVKIFQSPSWPPCLLFSGIAKVDLPYYYFILTENIARITHSYVLPRYRGPSNVVQLSRDDFQELVLSSKENRRNIWIVEFYVPWSEQVKTLDSLVAKLSLEYNNDILCFGKLNLASYPDIGMEFGIDTQSSTKVIPTFIVFERGKERQRVPCLDHRGMAVPKEVWRMKKSELVSALQLDHYVFISKMSK